ncbi:hypothetical protein [Clostridium scatologenes]|uniref:Uncharacterized protein n=1 Tax=Clostridium scatologenes TaxID=1548 RepID=A0A0E3M786_CLOSL|nr:hypothetical protein [Clostridium scatologenes]AKA68515.1 hypothetical protein CSCA_1390 [Clostridium scatologenes]
MIDHERAEKAWKLATIELEPLGLSATEGRISQQGSITTLFTSLRIKGKKEIVKKLEDLGWHKYLKDRRICHETIRVMSKNYEV